MTLALMGLPLVDWTIYCEPAHAQVYTPPDSPDIGACVHDHDVAMDERMRVGGRRQAQPPPGDGSRPARGENLWPQRN